MEEKVELAKNGNKEAFSELISNIKTDLYKIAKTRLHSEDDIADAIQETIISAYKYINKLKKNENFKKWIITILINKCNDLYKKDKKNKTISINELSEDIYKFNIKEIEELEINDILNVLKDDEKIIITLYYLENYTSKEIANILKINESTVRTKILRAKNKIKSSLGGIYNG